MSRAAIATAVVARLTAAGVAGGRVSRARTTEMDDSATLPAVVVYVLDGTADSLSGNRARYKETWDLKVECWAEGATDVALDDALDVVRSNCLAAMYQDPTFLAAYQMPGPVRTTTAYDPSTNKRRGILSIQMPLVVEATYSITGQVDGDYLTQVTMTDTPHDAVGTADGMGV